MKKAIGVITALVLMLTMAACAQSLAASEHGDLKDTGIVMRVVDETVTSQTDSVTVEYTNNTDTQFAFGEEPHLEIKKDGGWYVVPVSKDAAWVDIAYMLSPNTSDEKAFSLKAFYGDLEPGQYRIVKTFFADGGDVAAAAEFDIQ